MATELRNFAAVMLTAIAVGLGIAVIGVTQEAPGEDVPGRWHITDQEQAEYTTVTTVDEIRGHEHCGWQTVRMLHVEGSGFTDIWGSTSGTREVWSRPGTNWRPSGRSSSCQMTPSGLAGATVRTSCGCRPGEITSTWRGGGWRRRGRGRSR